MSSQSFVKEGAMKKVNVYQVTKSECLTMNSYITFEKFPVQDMIHVKYSDEFIVNLKTETVNLPVQKFVFSQQNWKGEVTDNVVYATFSDELLELIQCERAKFDNLNKDCLNLNMTIGTLKADVDWLKAECESLNKEIIEYKYMNFWKRLKFLFKGSL